MIPLRSFWKAASLLAPACLGGCAWLFGHAEPPQPPDPVAPIPAVARATVGGLAVEATWLGPGHRVVVARNLWGRAGRVVNPYGDDTFRVRVSLRATGPEPVVVVPERATLADGAGQVRKARTLADFRRRWPAWAVEAPDQETDRRAAYEHVLGELLIEREVGREPATAGVLAFPAFRPAGKLTLALPFRLGFKPGQATVTWEGL